MCGIVGVIAERNVAEIMLEGLKRLEYRGYDSAGLAVIQSDHPMIERLRVTGKVAGLDNELKKTPLKGSIGIAHTRWATHGKPTQCNAHPHCSEEDDIAVVHNGIIENHDELRQELQAAGYTFVTDTDTEVIVHLLHLYSKDEDDFVRVIHRATSRLEGAYALGIISTKTPRTLFAVRAGSPLVIGIGIGEHYIASDPLALLPVTQQFIYLNEGDIAKITTDNLHIVDNDYNEVERTIHTTDTDFETTGKGTYRHFMQKEIFEQQQAVLDTINGHVFNDEINIDSFGHNAAKLLSNVKAIQICACGTSYHAGLVARHWLESIAKIPTQVEIASEFRYQEIIVPPNTLFIALSQSGETADTLAALRSAKSRGYQSTLAICNVPESTLSREADLLFLALCFKQLHNSKDMAALIESLNHLPKLIQKCLTLDDNIKQLSQNFAKKQNAIFLGRGIHYPIALEGALKLKEISYVHGEAYPAGELKHGPLALVDQTMPVIVIAPKDKLTEKLASNIQEVQARGGEVYLFIDEELNFKGAANTHVIKMPHTSTLLSPIIYTIPLQLLAYHIAVLKGTDVDQPRNLAKSVTVE
jgi:glutamine---fructose-6-phosphate transaminase (isomerizing)